MITVQPAYKIPFRPEERLFVHEAIDRMMDTGQITNHWYSQMLARFWGRRHGLGAIAIGSCTAGLEMALRFSNVEGGEVIVPDYTFYATIAAIERAGAKPVLVDIDFDKWGMSVDAVEAALTKKTRAVIPVHILGHITYDMDQIAGLCSHKDLVLIEDCAQAHGVSLVSPDLDVPNRAAGSWGLAGVLSFAATKAVSSGEGGVLMSDDPELMFYVNSAREWGKVGEDVVFPGYTWKMSEPAAIVGLAKSYSFDQEQKDRAAIYAEYAARLPKFMPLRSRSTPLYYRAAFWMPDGMNQMKFRYYMLHDWGVDLPRQINMNPIHRQPLWEKHWGKLDDAQFPNSCEWSDTQVNFPLYGLMRRRELDYLIDAIDASQQRAMS